MVPSCGCHARLDGCKRPASQRRASPPTHPQLTSPIGHVACWHKAVPFDCRCCCSWRCCYLFGTMAQSEASCCFCFMSYLRHRQAGQVHTQPQSAVTEPTGDGSNQHGLGCCGCGCCGCLRCLFWCGAKRCVRDALVVCGCPSVVSVVGAVVRLYGSDDDYCFPPSDPRWATSFRLEY